MNPGSRLDQADLLNEQVHPDELHELLARLAATDALFAEPVPTIRDIAEATDASPLLIGRILSQMRGPDEVAQLKGRMDGFEARLRELEAQRNTADQKLPPIESILRDSGAGNFTPLGKQVPTGSTTTVSPELAEQKWSQVKDWSGSDSERIESVRDDILVRNSTYGVIVAVAFLYYFFVFGGQCNMEPRSQYDRPVTFPVETSTR